MQILFAAFSKINRKCNSFRAREGGRWVVYARPRRSARAISVYDGELCPPAGRNAPRALALAGAAPGPFYKASRRRDDDFTPPYLWPFRFCHHGAHHRQRGKVTSREADARRARKFAEALVGSGRESRNQLVARPAAHLT